MHKPAPTEYEILPVLAERWSPRAITAERPTPDELKQLFEAARWAPSAYNSQPWAFVYAFHGTPAFETLLAPLVPFNVGWAKHAGVLLIACAQLRTEKGELSHAMHDVGLAVENLMIQATALGLASHGMSGFSADKAKEVLAIPENWVAVTAIALGAPASADMLEGAMKERELAPRERKPQAAFTFEGGWTPGADGTSL